MPKTVFGRPGAGHPYDPLLDQWLASGDEERRAMGSNLAVDQRVSPEREARFDALQGEPRDPDALWTAVIKHHHDWIQQRHEPLFLAPDNFHNVVTALHGERPSSIPLDTKLARIIDLTGLCWVFKWAREAGLDAFERFPRGPTDASCNRWLEDTRKSQGSRSLVQDALEAMDRYGRTRPYQPTWATAWDLLERYRDAGATRLCQLMGLDKDAGHWVAVLVYTAREAGTVLRPTQLDAGQYDCHFPSPPGAPLSAGGHPMDLAADPAVPLLPEYIHRQIPHKIEHFDAGGGILGKLGENTRAANVIEGARQVHLDKLIALYGPAVARWLPAPFL